MAKTTWNGYYKALSFQSSNCAVSSQTINDDDDDDDDDMLHGLRQNAIILIRTLLAYCPFDGDRLAYYIGITN